MTILLTVTKNIETREWAIFDVSQGAWAGLSAHAMPPSLVHPLDGPQVVEVAPPDLKFIAKQSTEVRTRG